MQPTPGGQSSVGGGGGASGSRSGSGAGGELSRAALTSFRSAPATWLEALLQEEDEDPLKTNQCLSELLATDSAIPTFRNPTAVASSADLGQYDTSPASGFFRQNSSPAGFVGDSEIEPDRYVSNYGVPGNYSYASENISDVPSAANRAREVESQQSPVKYPYQMKVEQNIEMEMDKLLEDSVPCRVRAKRGCATHPRSIAERVRRTKISDRIRKLQELVPKMDKQTNTADMLEEAVEYVKFLQKQIEELTEHQRRCTCMVKVDEDT